MIGPVLGVLVGLPLSGKSTWAFKQADYRMVVCPDDYRLALCNREFHRPAERMVWAAAELSVRAFLKGGHSVLIDATNITAGRRQQWLTLADEFDVYAYAVLMDRSADECVKQAEKDNRPGMIEVIKDQAMRFETIDPVKEAFAGYQRVGG